MPQITEILPDGTLPAGELTARLGVSPATLMRRVRATGSAVVKIGASHATRYGLRRELPGFGASEVGSGDRILGSRCLESTRQ